MIEVVEMDLLDLLKSRSVKEFRGELLEASKNFAPGSVSKMVYDFERAIRDYYSDLLIHEFQLYSDRPKYVLQLDFVRCYLKDGEKDFRFNGNGRDLSVFKELNPIDAGDFSGVEFRFTLVPELKYLVKSVEFSFNNELFFKEREFSVARGDGEYYTGKFIPSWSQAGLKISCSGVSVGSAGLLGKHSLRGFK